MVETSIVVSAIVLGLVAVITIVIILILYNKIRGEKKNFPIVWNFNNFRSNNRSDGWGIYDKIGKDGRHLISYCPTDVDVEDDNAIIENEIKIISDNVVKIPRGGDFSQDREHWLIFPKKDIELPESLKNHEIGKYLQSYIKDKRDEKFNDKFNEEKRQRKESLKFKDVDGELSEEETRRQVEKFESLSDAVVKNKDKPDGGFLKPGM